MTAKGKRRPCRWHPGAVAEGSPSPPEPDRRGSSMLRTEFISTGMYVPDRVIKNDDLTQWMDTSDEWIRTRSGIQERRWAHEGQHTSDLALEAAKMALERAGMRAADLDCIIFATLSPEYMFPGS